MADHPLAVPDRPAVTADRPLLVAHDLGKKYGGVVALAGVDLRLDGGEILGLVGPNGAGKTTLVDLISGAQSADRGTLSLDGRPLTGPVPRRAAMGLARTFQYPQLALELTVRDNLLLGQAARRHATLPGILKEVFRGAVLPARRSDVDAVGRLSADLRLGDLDRPAGSLTLGEQRLVEVGRALTLDPVVLLLDEPFAGSDANSVASISEAIRAVARRGHGVILVDHNVDLVAALVQRVILLDRGVVAFDGDPKACLSSDEMRRVYFGKGSFSVS